MTLAKTRDSFFSSGVFVAVGVICYSVVNRESLLFLTIDFRIKNIPNLQITRSFQVDGNNNNDTNPFKSDERNVDDLRMIIEMMKFNCKRKIEELNGWSNGEWFLFWWLIQNETKQ